MQLSALGLLGLEPEIPEDTPDHVRYIHALFPNPKNYRENALQKFDPRPDLFSQAALATRPGMGYLASLQLTMLAPRNVAIEHQMVEIDAYLSQIIAYCNRSTQYYDRVKVWADRQIDEPVLAVDLETNGLDRRVIFDSSGEREKVTRVIGLCLGVNPNAGYYLPCGHTGDDGVLNWHPEVMTHALNRIFSATIPLIHNAQFDLFMSQINDVETIRPYPLYIDTQIVAFLYNTNEKSNGLKKLSEVMLGRPMVKIEELFGEKGAEAVITFDRICASDAYIYGCLDGTNTYGLFEWLISSPLRPLQFQHIVSHIDHELTLSLIDMYKHGMPVDYDYNMLALHDCCARKEMLRQFIYEEMGEVFDIDSPKQLSTIVYEKLGIRPLPHWEKGAQGLYSTGEEELEELAKMNPHVTGLTAVVDYRKISSAASKTHAKFLSNCFVDYRDPATRVNVDLNMTNVPTGRLSSSSGKGRSGVFVKFNTKDKKTIKSHHYFKGDWVWGGNSQGIGNPPIAKYKLKKIIKNPAQPTDEPYSPETKMEAARKVASWA